TNIVDRMTPGSADISPQEMAHGAEQLQKKLHGVRPYVMCWLGKDIYRTIKQWPQSRALSWGYQSPRHFVAPNPSRRSTLSYAMRRQCFQELADYTKRWRNPDRLPLKNL
ncbi:MAG: mismatch-specific DNA-glycosylase, partial [Firmicutes bacterium]|nr:mismatch-specific DNA-glycosylase [Bacillota bacterium]